eukprot:3005896-Rhodomonas_salina.2
MMMMRRRIKMMLMMTRTRMTEAMMMMLGVPMQMPALGRRRRALGRRRRGTRMTRMTRMMTLVGVQVSKRVRECLENNAARVRLKSRKNVNPAALGNVPPVAVRTRSALSSSNLCSSAARKHAQPVFKMAPP